MNKKYKRGESISLLVKQLIEDCGEDPSREGLKETPKRVSKMYQELLRGYSVDPKTVIKTFDSNGYNGLVTISNIKFFSLCEHHMIPFFGKVHIGYVPNGKVLGLSKFARLVEIYSRRLQIQENMTTQIADALETYLNPKGIVVHIEAQHLCISMRGVKKQDCITKTTVTRGLMSKNKNLMIQFNREINESKQP